MYRNKETGELVEFLKPTYGNKRVLMKYMMDAKTNPKTGELELAENDFPQPADEPNYSYSDPQIIDNAVTEPNPDDWEYEPSEEELAQQALLQKESEVEAALKKIESDHQQRLLNGIIYDGERYPCLKEDRTGIAGVIAGFDINETLFNEFAAKNLEGKPEGTTIESVLAEMTPEQFEAMISSGAVPPQYRKTAFEWSDGNFLVVTPETAKQISGMLSVLVSRSFTQKSAETQALKEDKDIEL